MKYHYILGVQIRLERVSLEDGLKLLEQVQRMLCARNIFKAGVNEALQCRLELCNVDVELKEIAVKSVAGVVKQIWKVKEVCQGCS